MNPDQPTAPSASKKPAPLIVATLVGGALVGLLCCGALGGALLGGADAPKIDRKVGTTVAPFVVTTTEAAPAPTAAPSR